MGHQAMAAGSVERRRVTSDRDGGSAKQDAPHATDLGDIENISPRARPAETPTRRMAELQQGQRLVQ